MRTHVKNILVVDDDASSNLLTAKMLKNTNLVENVWIASSAREALDLIETQFEADGCLPEIILLDIRMPDMDGWGFLETLNTRFNPRQIPKIVLLTGSTRTNDLIQSAMNPEVGLLINKPLTEFELKQVLVGYLSDHVMA